MVGVSWIGRGCTSDTREMTRDDESLRALGRLSESGFAGLFWIFGMRLVSRCGCGRTSVCERCTCVYERWTSVYESLRVVWTAVLVIHVMGCDLSLAGAGVLIPLSARVVRELYEPLHGGSCFGGNMAELAEMAGKLGRSGYNFFRGPCCRYAFASVFPIPESVPRFRQPLNESRFRQTRAGQLAVRGRASNRDGSGRVKSGQSGQFSYFGL